MTHELDLITEAIIDVSVKLHMNLGPGLLESVYETILANGLLKRGFQVERQKLIAIQYEGLEFENGFRADLLVNSRVIVELKSIERLAPVHKRQLLTYLRLSNLQVGLLINFGGATLREGLQRVVNNLARSDSPSLRANQKSP